MLWWPGRTLGVGVRGGSGAGPGRVRGGSGAGPDRVRGGSGRVRGGSGAGPGRIRIKDYFCVLKCYRANA